MFPYRNRICRVGNLSRRVGYEEKTRLAQNRFPNRQSKRHCVRNGNLPFVRTGVRIRRTRCFLRHRGRNFRIVFMAFRYIQKSVRGIDVRHRRTYVRRVLHSIFFARRYIETDVLRISRRTCVLSSRCSGIRRAQKIRALHIPLFRACRSGVVFDCNVSSNSRQIKNLWQSNNLAHQQKYTAEK